MFSTPITDEITSLLNTSLEKCSSYIHKNSLEAYRLFHAEYPPLPVAIDIYKDNAVIHLFSRVELETTLALESVLRTHFGIIDFFYKNRTKMDIELPQSSNKEITINEFGNKFHINLSDYLDTGLFLDHRETRRWIGQQSRNKTVLNTFAYSGSFSIYAARGGATKTYSVDLSKTYCEWIKKNVELNNLPPEKNWIYKMDTFEFFRYARRKQLIFDIIIIDPPTFSRNKGNAFSLQKDHPRLINEALELLAPEGFILFSNNYRDFSLSRDLIKTDHIEQKEDTIPPDFAESIPHWCYIVRPP